MKHPTKLFLAILAGAGLCIPLWRGAEATSVYARDRFTDDASSASTKFSHSAYEAAGAAGSADPSPADDLADVGDLCDKCNGPDWVWTAGIEATYLTPNAHSQTITDGGQAGLLQGNILDFDKFEAAPRVWLGLENDCGRGIRARYWKYDTCNSRDTLILDSEQDTVRAITEYSNLEAYTIDLEFTARGEAMCWDWLGTAGVRNGAISRNAAIGVFDSDLGIDALQKDVQFNGTGLTASLEGRHPFGCRELSLIANVRGSALWGKVKNSASAALGEVILESPLLATGCTCEDSTLWIFESQVGVEWSHDLTCCRGRVFARALFEYQYWNVNNPSVINLEATNESTISIGSLASRVDFYGPTFAVGFSR